MESIFFHPKLVHLPIALAMLMPLIAAAVVFAMWRKWLAARTWLVVIALQAVLVASSVVALRTGKAQEDRVEQVVAERYLEAHEDAAQPFVWASGIVLGLMVLAQVLSTRRVGTTTAIVATAGTVMVLWLGFRAGKTGGELVYKHGAAQAYVDGATELGTGDPSVADNHGGTDEHEAH